MAVKNMGDMRERCSLSGGEHSQMFSDATAAKRQKMDSQPGCGSQNGMFSGGAPGLLGAAPPIGMFWSTPCGSLHAGFQPRSESGYQPRMEGQFSGGDGLLPVPFPVWPNLLPKGHRNDHLSIGDTGSLQSVIVAQNQQLPDNVLPEIPAEREIERISSELNTLEKQFNLLMSSTTATGDARRTFITEFRRSRERLQKELKQERERQHLENMMLSKQLEQQYNFSLGSSPCGVPVVEEKQNIDTSGHSKDSAQHSDSRKTENETAVAALSRDFLKLTCQIADLDSRIEDLVIEEEEQSTMQRQQLLKGLRNQRKSLKKELAKVRISRQQMLRQAAETRFGIDPLAVLKKLSKKITTWRFLRHSEFNLNQRRLNKRGVCLPVKENLAVEDVEVPLRVQSQKQEETEAIIISDEEEDVIVLEASCKQTSQLKAVKKRSVTTHIDRCVTDWGLTAHADQSYFVLSGLANVLMAKQQHRRLPQPQNQTETQPQSGSIFTPEGLHVLSQVMGQMTSRLKLISPREANSIAQKT